MASGSPAYRRLRGGKVGVATYGRLYEGPDHFLQVSSSGFTESYKRFYFRDIQAIIVERKPWRLWWSIILIAVILLFVAPASVSSGAGAVILWSLAAVFSVGLIANVSAGPACACYIRTAVQTERLLTVNRLPRARAFVTRVEGLIAASQENAAPDNAQNPAAEKSGGQPAAEESIPPPSNSNT